MSLTGFHHLNNDFDRPLDRCEVHIRVPLSINDFSSGIFDIAGLVVKQLKYFIKVLSPDSEDALVAANLDP